ncbi:MAG TPA: FG-GAP-like repeat-containing protein, partial [Anaeromyxobacteraceae bacterium]|nr:FG-GAP-like repeat-containing protein [Anaeromyxobacteraceae bacterium]
MTEIVLALVAAAGALPSFPRQAGGPVGGSVLGIALDGQPAVVAVAGERLVAFRASGATAPGFPVALGAGEAPGGAPAAADMDGDRRPEIAVVTLAGKVVLWADGRVAPGFPRSLGARARAGPSFADVDGDGRPELLAGDEAGRVHAFKKNGREARGWPVPVGAAVTSSVSSARFGGGHSFAVGCQDGRVHVLDAQGRERPGFPLKTDFEVTGAPAFADLDDDGSMDLVVASQDFKLHAVNGKGEPLPGFPVAAGYRIYEGPAIADLDGDGRLDVVFASADGRLYAVDAGGAPLPGFPVRVGPRVFGGAALGDVDRDGKLEAVAVSSDGQVVAVSAEGKALPGFPTRLEAQDLGATPLLFDLAQDGSPAVFVGVPSGEVHGLRAPRSGNATAVVAWSGGGRDAARGGRFGPNPPRYRELRLEPEAPRIGDKLVARWRWAALDADPADAEPTPQVEWLRDGRPAPELKGRREVPPRTARKGERWSFAVSGGGAAPSRSAEVAIANTPPGPAQVELDPDQPSRAAPVKLVVVKSAADADGDPLTYRVDWLVDGRPTGVSGTTFTPERLRRGQLLTARVVASDGEAESPAAIAEAFAGDTAPGPVAVALVPEVPRRETPISVKVVSPATDADGDQVSYRHRWTVGGEPRNAPLGSGTLPPGAARKGQLVRVEVRAFDGILEGPPATAEVKVVNTPPGEPRVEIRPERPRSGVPLRATVVAEAPDPDRDALVYRFAWKRNGAPLPAPDPREVPAAEVRRADRFELEAWAFDGEAEGPRAKAVAVVGNTPPSAPLVAIDPERPRGGGALKLVMLRPAEDPDGDPVRYDIAWTHDGKPTGGAASRELLLPSFFRKHETVRVTVTPHDGREAGQPGSAQVVVANALPGAPEVGLSPARPTVSTPLEASIRRAAEDPDGDRLGYRYRWLRDGFAVAVPDASAESRREPYWTGSSAVPAAMLKKGQRWTAEVQAADGEAQGPVARAEVTVVNSPPPAPRVAIAPASPRRGDGIEATPEQPPEPDGDRVTYRYAWTRNGARMAFPEEQASVPRNLARKGERWAVQVIASDGEADSPPARAEVEVGNTPPGPVAVGLCDAPVPTGTPLEAKIRAPAVDADGDAVVYRYEWSVNGKPAGVAQGQARLGASTLRKHDLVRVVATPWDGQGAGPPATAECLVKNTPPGAPEIGLEPREPTAATGLQVTIRRNAPDRDGDAVSYRYRWLRDGLPAGVETAKVGPGVARHGESWRAVVTPFDGESEGEPASATAVVRNTPPPPPAVAVKPESPSGGQPLACEARGAERDADQEKVELHTRWLVNGKPAPVAEDLAALPAGVARRGETWRCEAWTSDGFDASARVRAEVTVRNSPPSAPAVAIEPEKARKGDGLDCRVAIGAVDPDGDRVSHAYAWFKNDQPAPAGPEPSRIPPERIARGQRWRCQVTASDGAAAGP